MLVDLYDGPEHTIHEVLGQCGQVPTNRAVLVHLDDATVCRLREERHTSNHASWREGQVTTEPVERVQAQPLSPLRPGQRHLAGERLTTRDPQQHVVQHVPTLEFSIDHGDQVLAVLCAADDLLHAFEGKLHLLFGAVPRPVAVEESDDVFRNLTRRCQQVVGSVDEVVTHRSDTLEYLGNLLNVWATRPHTLHSVGEREQLGVGLLAGSDALVPANHSILQAHRRTQ